MHKKNILIVLGLFSLSSWSSCIWAALGRNSLMRPKSSPKRTLSPVLEEKSLKDRKSDVVIEPKGTVVADGVIAYPAVDREQFMKRYRTEVDMIWRNRISIEKKYIADLLAKQTISVTTDLITQEQGARLVLTDIPMLFIQIYSDLYKRLYKQSYSKDCSDVHAQEVAEAEYMRQKECCKSCIIL